MVRTALRDIAVATIPSVRRLWSARNSLLGEVQALRSENLRLHRLLNEVAAA
jgi:hypothetical protein